MAIANLTTIGFFCAFHRSCFVYGIPFGPTLTTLCFLMAGSFIDSRSISARSMGVSHRVRFDLQQFAMGLHLNLEMYLALGADNPPTGESVHELWGMWRNPGEGRNVTFAYRSITRYRSQDV
ncbi:hypothetical protein IFM89_024505 [Coptis chinensis]|uniref:Uncharacterized protein n=1 Tax=Coptis chinensis TaxID=261450 RepID=A0A835H8S0_9MAGN|nr:hypothetical protein IFM89_024505 [Coptis chinensis]